MRDRDLERVADAARDVLQAYTEGRLVAVPDEKPCPEMDALEASLYEARTDYRCPNGHVFAVPWGDEAPRSTVVCPTCIATAFLEWPTEAQGESQ